MSATGTKERVIAVPSLDPGGLDAERSGHFGHCEYFTLVEVDGDDIVKARTVENAPHGENGCLDPVMQLHSLGATDIVVGGMGPRPLALFNQMGIAVYVDQELPTVKEAVDALLGGDVPAMTPLHVCGGGDCH